MNKTRKRIVETADELFYQQGYARSSFAQIAEKLSISRGNFYYHFKSKDEILDAVIQYRISKTSGMLDQWDTEGSSPKQKIQSFVHILLRNKPKIILYGCPVGSLSSELIKLNHDSKNAVNYLYDLFLNWLSHQFCQLGLTDTADDLAMHLLALSQGVATMASAFPDKNIIDKEVIHIHQWLDRVTENTD